MSGQSAKKRWPRRTVGLTFLLTFALFLTVSAIQTLAAFLFALGVLRGWIEFDPVSVPPLIGFSLFSLCSVIVVSVMAILRSLVLDPIQHMVSDMKRLAAGDFAVRTAVGGRFSPRELKEFAAAFNTAAEELGGVELLRKDFINSFSHELKTPITSLGGFADLLLENEAIAPEERREYLRLISGEARRLAGLASNVLALSRLESQTILTGAERFDLAEQLRQTVLLMEKKWRSKDIDIRFEGEKLFCTGNEALLKEVWMNLLDNAVKFSPPGGAVTLTLKQEREGAAVVIRDEGPGMDGSVLPHIFEQFYQGDPSRRTEGNGLGLAIVQRIVALHGGSVTVESSPGRGSAFAVRLPEKSPPRRRSDRRRPAGARVPALLFRDLLL